jgi:hypothetical protein
MILCWYWSSNRNSDRNLDDFIALDLSFQASSSVVLCWKRWLVIALVRNQKAIKEPTIAFFVRSKDEDIELKCELGIADFLWWLQWIRVGLIILQNSYEDSFEFKNRTKRINERDEFKTIFVWVLKNDQTNPNPLQSPEKIGYSQFALQFNILVFASHEECNCRLFDCFLISY